MGAHLFRATDKPLDLSDGTFEGLQGPLERVLVHVGLLLKDAGAFPPQVVRSLETIHREAAKAYETVTRLAWG